MGSLVVVQKPKRDQKITILFNLSASSGSGRYEAGDADIARMRKSRTTPCALRRIQ